MRWTSFGSSWQIDLACCRLGVKLETHPLQGAGVEETTMHEAAGMSVKLVSKHGEEAVTREHHVEGSRSWVRELIFLGKEYEREKHRRSRDVWANHHGSLRES